MEADLNVGEVLDLSGLETGMYYVRFGDGERENNAVLYKE
jgi:hypothetical protein